MKPPDFEDAIVPEGKLTGYLLSATHRDGRHKAAFFFSFGFSVDASEALAAALKKHATSHDIAKEEETPFGIRYVVEGTIEAPDGRAPRIRSVWFVESGQGTPVFVTAYPLGGAGDD